jgi:hypothetical protein
LRGLGRLWHQGGGAVHVVTADLVFCAVATFACQSVQAW